MPKIEEYTQGIVRQRAVPNTVNLQAIQDAGAVANTVSQVSSGLNDVLVAEEEKRNNRYDTIQRARAVSDFQTKMMEEYTKFESENDLADPDSAKAFNQLVRNKRFEYISQHQGSKDSKASLEVQLTALSDQLAMRMTEASIGAQNKLVGDQIGTHVNRISAEVRANPLALFDNAFKQVDGLLYEYKDALPSTDEQALRRSIRGQLTESAMDSYIDSGDFSSADKIMGDIDMVENLSPEKQAAYFTKINAGNAVKNKRIVETQQRQTEVQAMEQSGLELTPESKLKYVYGADVELTLESKLKNMKLENKNITDEQALAIANPELYKARKEDKNDLRTVIGKEIAPLYTMQAKMIGLKASADQVRKGNKVAGLSAITTWKQTFEPSSAVMEGEVELNKTAESLSGMIDNMTKPGQVVSEQMVNEMEAVAQQFVAQYAKAIKKNIDPYLKQAEKMGMSWADVHLPEDKYQSLFGTAELGKDATSILDQSTEDLLRMATGK